MQATPMMLQYLEIKSRHQNELLFYRMGDFYELFFDDAVKAAETLDIALTTRGKHLEQDIPMCGVPVHSHEMYLLKLIKAGHRIAIAEQLEDPAEAKKRGYKEVVKRDVVRIVTPGTITEDALLTGEENSYLVAIVLKKDSAALAWADISGRTLNTQMIKIDQVDGLLAQLSPKEILISEKHIQTPELFDVFKKWKGVMTLQPHQKFSEQSATESLKRVYRVHSLDVFGKLDVLEQISLGALVDYVQLTQKIALTLPFPRQIKPDHFMIIDGNTRANLELITSQRGTRKGSLLDCLDMNVTKPGARLFERLLTSPLTSVLQLNKRLDGVDYFKNTPEVREKLRGILKLTPDLERSLTRVLLGRCKPRDLVQITKTLQMIATLKTVLSGRELPPILRQATQNLGQFDLLMQELMLALNDTMPANFQDGGLIKDGYLADLDEFRHMKENADSYVQKLQDRYIAETGVNTLKVKQNNILGYFIEVTSQHAEKLMGRFQHRQSLANAIRFTSPELQEVENKINNAVTQALAIEMQAIEHIVGNIRSVADDLFLAAESIAQLDVLAALAELAQVRNYVRPTLDESTEMNIVEGRHPLVEVALQQSSSTPFVANNYTVEEKRVWLLTGPNMGGKSTFLRQNALIVIMAQIGCFVPATNAKIGVVDRLFSRVGAADDLARNQSTFMVEMVETASILHQATEKSLVILDEIGRGTSTYDGLAIAWSVLEHLHNKTQCRTLFATHYHELTVLQKTLPQLGLYTTMVKEWDDHVIFMHQVIEGVANKSYGIHVARLAGVPPSVIERAEEILVGLKAA